MFTTKTYTINLLINEVSSLTNSQASTVSSFTTALSPRAGARSAKITALNRFLNGNLAAVINGTGSYSSFGKSARTRVIRALRNRKNS